MNVEAVVLAAGQGTRMKSSMPKVLHQLAGKPLLAYVLDVARQVGAQRLHTVIGHGSDQVKTEFAACEDINWVLQKEQLGTGHAVLQAMPQVDVDSTILILYGDVPLLSANTLRQLLHSVTNSGIALLTVELHSPVGYGRIVRDEMGKVASIVEEKDATDAQKSIGEVNTGILAVRGELLYRWLPMLSNDNAQGEFYLTDIIAMATSEGYNIAALHPAHHREVEGINSRPQLAAMERWHQRQLADKLMTAGVTLLDPDRIDIRGTLTSGTDTIVDVNLVAKGEVSLGREVVVGPNCVIINSTIGDNVRIHANSVIEDAVIEDRAEIGPFARIRPGTVLREDSKIGNFVETKNTDLGRGSKVSHLSYIGDSEVGEKVNIGAGTITCNYDGANKFKTLIGDGVFVGSNTSLIAPISLGENSTVGAGSTINFDVAEGKLAVARGRQKIIDGWERPRKKKKNS